MPFQIITGDLTKMQVDAIINPANPSLLKGGGLCGVIHRAAGKELLAECRTLGGCDTGCAKITGAYRLPCKYVIHAVGPRWLGGGYGERDALLSCYRSALRLAKEYRCRTVAFPLISAGHYGYPKDQAEQIAVEAITGFVADADMKVYLVLYDEPKKTPLREKLERTFRRSYMKRAIRRKERSR